LGWLAAKPSSTFLHVSYKTVGKYIHWDDRQDEWVGSRPVTPDGLPLVGATKAPNVYTNGGHGMWGIILGPLSGKMLAKQIETGEVDETIAPFDPLRGPFGGL